MLIAVDHKPSSSSSLDCSSGLRLKQDQFQIYAVRSAQGGKGSAWSKDRGV